MIAYGLRYVQVLISFLHLLLYSLSYLLQGVGKTEVCKSLAETYYGREKVRRNESARASNDCHCAAMVHGYFHFSPLLPRPSTLRI